MIDSDLATGLIISSSSSSLSVLESNSNFTCSLVGLRLLLLLTRQFFLGDFVGELVC